MSNLIGISGKMRSGKNSVATIIQGLNMSLDYDMIIYQLDLNKPFEASSGYEQKALAGKLKDIVCLLIGCTRDELESGAFKTTPLNSDWDESHGIDTPRDLLQVLGTNCGRDMIHPNIWVNALFADYKKDLVMVPDTDPNSRFDGSIQNEGPYPCWIITDMRFPNELEAIKSRGGLTIRVNTNRAGELSNHESETALDSAAFDYVIDNSGTLVELIEEVKRILIAEQII